LLSRGTPASSPACGGGEVGVLQSAASALTPALSRARGRVHKRAGASPAPSMRRPGVKGGGCGWGEGSGGFGCGSCWSVAAGCVLRGPGVGAPDDLLSVAGCAGKPNPACAIKAPVHTQGRTVPSTVTVVRRPGAGTDSSKPARPTDHAFLIRLPSRSLPRPRYAALSRAPCGTQSNSR
jgi:hypothetical protein